MGEKETNHWQNRFWDSVKGNFVTDEIFWQNEINSNILVAKTLVGCACIMVITWAINAMGWFTIDKRMMNLTTVRFLFESLIPAGLCMYFKGKKRWLKYLMMLEMVIILARLDSILTFDVIIVIAIPVVLSCRYYSRSFTAQVAITTTILFAVASFCGAYLGMGRVNMNFYNEDRIKYTRNIMMLVFLPRWFIFALIASVCSEIAKVGRGMVLAQDSISREHSRVETELQLASKIQEQALPIVHTLSDTYKDIFDLFAMMVPAKEVGGDFYDFFNIDSTHLAMMVADVSGKGVPAALFMMVSKLLLDNSLNSEKSPSKVLTEVNHILCEKKLEDMFVTVWLGVLDLETGKLVASNAGHEFPIISRKGGDFEIFKDKHGFVLGGMDGIRYKEYELQLDVGDTIFLYTDGVAEANNPHEELFGLERTVASLNKYKDRNMEELLKCVKADLDAFAADTPQFDDTTMMALRMKKYMVKEGITVSPDKDSLAVVADYVNSKLEESEVPMKALSKVAVAVDEIYSNVVNYSGASWADICCKVEGDSVVVNIKDNGIPYNPLEKEDPDVTLSVEEREIGGLGIFMTKKLMDDVDYRYIEGHNETILLLKI